MTDLRIDGYPGKEIGAGHGGRLVEVSA
jgi:hypothetical protein